jgi:hypothetical protein
MDFLTERKYSQLLYLAERKAKTLLRSNRVRTLYEDSHFTHWRVWIENGAYRSYLNNPCRSKNDLLKVAGLAYSWMPTMLDFYFPADYDFTGLLRLVKKCKNQVITDDEKRTLVSELASNINHSVVGASKVLHIICPEFVPFTDSRVIKGWNGFFSSEIRKNKIFKLPFSWNYNSDKSLENKVTAYINYWNALLQWKTNMNNEVSIRDLEVLLYFIGGNNRIA